MNTVHQLAAIVLQEISQTLDQVPHDQFANLSMAIRSAPRIFLAGKGRSGLRMQGFGMRLMHLDLPVYIVGETTTPAIGAGDLLLIGSGSGRTATLVVYAERALALGATVALVTITEASPIARLADLVIALPAPTPKIGPVASTPSIQPLGTLFEQALGILLDLLVLQLMADMGVNGEAMFGRHANLE